MLGTNYLPLFFCFFCFVLFNSHMDTFCQHTGGELKPTGCFPPPLLDALYYHFKIFLGRFHLGGTQWTLGAHIENHLWFLLLLSNSGNRQITLMGSHLDFVDGIALSHSPHKILTFTETESQVSASSVLLFLFHCVISLNLSASNRTIYCLTVTEEYDSVPY